MVKALKDIAELQLGYSFRTGAELVLESDLKVIQLKNLDDSGLVSLKDVLSVDAFDSSDKYIVQRHDLLFKTRGVALGCSYVDIESSNLIFAAPLIRIRVKDDRGICPEYLYWYLNSIDAKRYIANHLRSGTSIFITKENLENMLVELPTIAMQKEVVDIFNMFEQEKKLSKNYFQKKEYYIQNKLSEIVKGE